MINRRKMTVTMEVTDAQGLALEAMFRYWRKLGSQGSSRHVSFMVDGDGDFKPKCVVEFPEGRPVPEMTLDEAEALALGDDNNFDYDTIGWALDSSNERYRDLYVDNVRPYHKRIMIETYLRQIGGNSGTIALLDELEKLDPGSIPAYRLVVLAVKLSKAGYRDAFHNL